MTLEQSGSVAVAAVGECLVGLRSGPSGPLHAARSLIPHIVGAESNTAIGLTRLGHRAAFIGRVGDDGLGESVRRALRAEEVDVSRLSTDPEARTGLLIREQRGFGSSRLWYYRDGSAGSRLTVTDIVDSTDVISAASWLHISGVTLALSATARSAGFAAIDLARSVGTRVAFDVNLRTKLWSKSEARPILRRAAAGADVVFASGDEARLLTDEEDPWRAANALLDLGARTAVVRLGSRGAISVHTDGTRTSCDAPSVAHVVDTVGAGDAFTAGYLAGRLENLDHGQCLRLGTVCGAYAVAAAGDVTGLPSRDETRAWAEGADDAVR